MTPFIGVRISWLIVARKALLALLASSASRVAASSSAVRAVDELLEDLAPTALPAGPAEEGRGQERERAGGDRRPEPALLGERRLDPDVVFAPVVQAPPPRLAATSKT